MKYVVLVLLVGVNVLLASFAFDTASVDTDLERKIAALLIVAANPENVDDHINMGIQNVHVFLRDTPKQYIDLIGMYTAQRPGIMVSADLEGCRNPFPWHDSLHVSGLTPSEFEYKFSSDLSVMQQVGITVNYAPVLDMGDTVWGCRSISEEVDTVIEFGTAYVSYMEQNGIHTAVKHYPGATLYDDTHLVTADNVVSRDDLRAFHDVIASADPSMVMVNHLVSTGEIDSGGVPNSVSPVTISVLRNHFDGIIVSDELSMLGLVEQFDSLEEVYLALMVAGVDMVPYFTEDPRDLHNFVDTVAMAVETGLIPYEQIDQSYQKVMALQN